MACRLHHLRLPHIVAGMQVMQAYERSAVPQPGEEFEFCPDASLQPVHYQRGRASEGLVGQYVHRAAIAAAEAEAGEGLGSWTVVALCRSLSLDNILLLLTGEHLILQSFSHAGMACRVLNFCHGLPRVCVLCSINNCCYYMASPASTLPEQTRGPAQPQYDCKAQQQPGKNLA